MTGDPSPVCETTSNIISADRWMQVGGELGLTPRELDVALCVVDDLSMSKIAKRLCIREETVHSHLARIYRKLGVRGRTGVVSRLFSAHLRLPPRAGMAREHTGFG